MNGPDWRAEERVPLLRMLTPADWVSLGNGLLGLLAIVAAQAGAYRASFSLILVALLFDGVDGHLARHGYGGGRLGGKLDSLNDLVSFAVAPALLFWHAHAGRPWLGASDVAVVAGSFLVFALAVSYFAAGLLRLARFDYLQGGDQQDYFLGIASPAAAAVVASVALLPWDTLPSLLVVGLFAYLMASRLRLPKLRGTLAAAGGGIVLAAAIIGDSLGHLGPTLILVFALVYLLLGPGYVRRRIDTEDVPWA